MKKQDSDFISRIRAAALPEDRRNAGVMKRVRAHYYETACRDSIVREALSDLVDEALENLDLDENEFQASGRGIMIVGESGQGKSRIVKSAFNANPFFSVAGREGHGFITLMVKTPKPSSLSGLGVHILNRTNYPKSTSGPYHEIWRKVRERLRHLGVMFLWIDEFQHVIDRKNIEELREIRDTLKTLLEYEGWPIYVVISGLPHMVTLLEKEPSQEPENDVQAVRRYAFMSLPGLDLPDEMEVVRKALRDTSATAGLALSFSDAEDLLQRLCHAGLYRFGLTIELICDAIRVAVRAGEDALAEEHFAHMYGKRTGSLLNANPFVVETGWQDIDCTKVLKNRNVEEYEEEDVNKEVRRKLDKTERLL